MKVLPGDYFFLTIKTKALLMERRARGGENLRLPGLLGFVGYG
jgi:hypothetical protein